MFWEWIGKLLTLERGTLYVGQDTGSVRRFYGTRFMGLRFMIYDLWFMVYGLWFMVYGLRF